MHLYEIREEYLKAMDSLVVNEDGEILNANEIEELKGDFDEKTEAVACYIKDLIAETEALENEKKACAERFDTRINANTRRIDWLKDYLTFNVRSVGMNKFDTSKVSISFRKSEKVEIPDEFQIPEAYMKVTTTVTKKPDKTLIKKAIKEGNEVNGATLVVKDNIQLK